MWNTFYYRNSFYNASNILDQIPLNLHETLDFFFTITIKHVYKISAIIYLVIFDYVKRPKREKYEMRKHLLSSEYPKERVHIFRVLVASAQMNYFNS